MPQYQTLEVAAFLLCPVVHQSFAHVYFVILLIVSVWFLNGLFMQQLAYLNAVLCLQVKTELQ